MLMQRLPAKSLKKPENKDKVGVTIKKEMVEPGQELKEEVSNVKQEKTEKEVSKPAGGVKQEKIVLSRRRPSMLDTSPVAPAVPATEPTKRKKRRTAADAWACVSAKPTSDLVDVD